MLGNLETPKLGRSDWASDPTSSDSLGFLLHPEMEVKFDTSFDIASPPGTPNTVPTLYFGTERPSPLQKENPVTGRSALCGVASDFSGLPFFTRLHHPT